MTQKLKTPSRVVLAIVDCITNRFSTNGGECRRQDLYLDLEGRYTKDQIDRNFRKAVAILKKQGNHALSVSKLWYGRWQQYRFEPDNPAIASKFLAYGRPTAGLTLNGTKEMIECDRKNKENVLEGDQRSLSRKNRNLIALPYPGRQITNQ